MKHYMMHTNRWDRLNWRGKLKLRWQALRVGALVKPNVNCPPENIYLLDPDYHYFESLK